MENNREKQDCLLKRLRHAEHAGLSQSTCLGIWSKFIRERDGHCCLACGNTKNLSAHHICRKSFLKEAMLMTGNGITLCKVCHKEVHKGFNGRPNLNLPMDSQGGEKIETLTTLFKLLVEKAQKKEKINDDYYFLSDQIICKFKLLQGYAPFEEFPGSRIEQAYYIWNASSLNMRNVLFEANGFHFIKSPFLPGISVIYD